MSLPSVALGRMSDGSYRLRCSREGYSAANLTLGVNAISFDSEWTDSLKIHQYGTLALTPGETVSVNYPSLGYTPLAWGMVYKPSNGRHYVHHPDVSVLYFTTATQNRLSVIMDAGGPNGLYFDYVYFTVKAM